MCSSLYTSKYADDCPSFILLQTNIFAELFKVRPIAAMCNDIFSILTILVVSSLRTTLIFPSFILPPMTNNLTVRYRLRRIAHAMGERLPEEIKGTHKSKALLIDGIAQQRILDSRALKAVRLDSPARRSLNRTRVGSTGSGNMRFQYSLQSLFPL